MQYRQIADISKPISTLALGGWLTLGESLDDARALSLLEAAVAGGVNLIDLADVYAAGGAERVVGSLLQRNGDLRDRLVIASKVFWPTSDDPADRGLSRRHVHESIDRTLERLGIEQLDLYYCHREDPTVPLHETVQAMGDLVRSGKIAAWGTSCWRPTTLREAHRLAGELAVAPPRVEQSPYNLLERWAEVDIVPCCRELGMALVAFSPLAQGALTGKYVSGRPAGSRAATSNWVDEYLRQDHQRAVRAFVDMCRSRDLDPPAVALAWVTQQPGFVAAIFGATSEQQLTRNLAAARLTIDTELAARLDAVFPPARRPWWRRAPAEAARHGPQVTTAGGEPRASSEALRSTDSRADLAARRSAAP